MTDKAGHKIHESDCAHAPFELPRAKSDLDNMNRNTFSTP